MLNLSEAAGAWGTERFVDVLKRAIEALNGAGLPLQRGLTRGSYVGAAAPKIMIIDTADAGPTIRVRAGVFYTGIIGGCSCADDPTPVEEEPEYCELEFAIDRTTGQATVLLVGDAGD